MPFTVLKMFPTCIVKSNIGRDFTKKELDLVDYHKQHVISNHSNFYSKDSYVLNAEEFSDIKKFIEYGISAYVQSIIIPASNNIEFYITQSWINYNHPGEYHHRHPHPNSIISGVLYINSDLNSHGIEVHKNNYKQIRIEPKIINPLNTTREFIPTSTGDLLLFSSDLEHSVPTSTSQETRVSLAFNVFVRGDLWVGDQLSKLTIL